MTRIPPRLPRPGDQRSLRTPPDPGTKAPRSGASTKAIEKTASSRRSYTSDPVYVRDVYRSSGLLVHGRRGVQQQADEVLDLLGSERARIAEPRHVRAQVVGLGVV